MCSRVAWFSHKSGDISAHLLPEVLVRNTDTHLNLFDSESGDASDSGELRATVTTTAVYGLWDLLQSAAGMSMKNFGLVIVMPCGGCSAWEHQGMFSFMWNERLGVRGILGRGPVDCFLCTLPGLLSTVH